MPRAPRLSPLKYNLQQTPRDLTSLRSVPTGSREAVQTLGFFGSGETPERILELLLDDQLSAAGGRVEFVFGIGPEPNPSMSTLLELSRGRGRVEILATTLDLEVFGWAAMVNHSADLVSALINRLAKAKHPKLLVLWDEGSDTQRAVAEALNLEIEVRDLCDALTRLGALPDDKEHSKMPTSTSTQHTLSDLEAMPEDELTTLAESLGIDVAAVSTWEEVFTLVLAQQDSSSAPSSAAGETAEEDGGGAEPYVRTELEAMQLDQLKLICETNGIKVEGLRPRMARYIDAILVAQENASDSEAEPEAEPAEPTRHQPAAQAAPKAASDPLLLEIKELLIGRTDLLAARIEEVSEALTERLASLQESARSITTQNGTGPTATKAALPVRKALKRI